MFPENLSLPGSVLLQRKLRKKEMTRTALRGMILRFIIVALELYGFWAYKSATLLVDALSTLIDIFSSILLVISIQAAERPPDREHPFGHGRYEPLAGLQLGLFLILTGIVFLVQQFMALCNQEEGHIIDSTTWIIPLVAVILLELAHKKLIEAAHRQNSTALIAEALHYRIDSLNTIVALVILGIAALIPEWSDFIDHIGAILIAVVMMCMGLYASKNNLNQVLDRAPDASYFIRVRESALKVKEVHDTEKIRIQLYGPDAHVDIDIEVDPHMSVESAHEITQRVRRQIQEDWPAVREVVVHVEPYYLGDH